MKILSVLLLIFLIGCSGVSSKATEENFKKIELEAPSAKVVELIGESDKKTRHPQFPSLEIWYYGDTSHVTLDAGKVVAVMYHDKMLVEKLDPEED